MPQLRTSLFYSLVGAVVLLTAVLAPRVHWHIDASSSGRQGLHPSSQALLQSLDSPLEIKAFVPDLLVPRREVMQLIDRLRTSGAQIQLTFVDPLRDPEQTRRFEVRKSGSLHVTLDGRSEVVETATEASLTDTVARLSRQGSPWVVSLTGHGERALLGDDPADLGAFAALLERRGYKLLTLAASDTPQLPENASLVILAAPQSDLLAGELASLAAWLDQGGNLLWLTDNAKPTLLADRFGFSLLPGQVVDAAAAALGFDTPEVAVSARHPDHPVTAALQGPVVAPGAKALRLAADSPWRTTTLLQSSPQSWNETSLIAGQIKRDDTAGEMRGPLPLGVALERTTPTGMQRIAILGDSDLFSNASLGLHANRAFGLALVHWLTAQRHPSGTPPRQARDAQIRWHRNTAAGTVAVLLVGLPLLLLVTGFSVRYRRERG